ncbi:phosphoglycerate mutase family protein [Oceaniovalibus guishaninsula JLT2003]|uniref:Phosphoglycerate mutase family protein n=2 Tax=Oceaniovalibus TaxID=1207070 RepID=K2H8E2_9RHOB|nr:phosphoglycerate mutase family protein [Oceaniovalibus guishaninsula JLT2003]
MVGWSDLPADLSDAGLLDRLSGFLPAKAPVVSSTLLRAIVTADAIRGDRPLLPPDPDLREMSFGDWELRSHDEIAQEDPVGIRAFWDSPGDVRPPGGESWNDLRMRVDAAADRLMGLAPEIVVVAHFGPILTQIQRAGGLTTRQAFAQRIDNLSVTRVDLGNGRAEPVNHIP